MVKKKLSKKERGICLVEKKKKKQSVGKKMDVMCLEVATFCMLVTYLIFPLQNYIFNKLDDLLFIVCTMYVNVINYY